MKEQKWLRMEKINTDFKLPLSWVKKKRNHERMPAGKQNKIGLHLSSMSGSATHKCRKTVTRVQSCNACVNYNKT